MEICQEKNLEMESSAEASNTFLGQTLQGKQLSIFNEFFNLCLIQKYTAIIDFQFVIYCPISEHFCPTRIMS